MSWYALASYQSHGTNRPAMVLGGRLFDLSALAAPGGDRLLSAASSVGALLAQWEEAEPALKKLVAIQPDIDPIDSTPLAPFEPYRLFCAASNYAEHAEEVKQLAAKAESTPFVFLKSQSSVIGTGAPVEIPPESKKVDWEVELGVVIGRAGRRISLESAEEHIAGYVVINDVSARDLTRRTDFPFSHDWFRGKSFDSFIRWAPGSSLAAVSAIHMIWA